MTFASTSKKQIITLAMLLTAPICSFAFYFPDILFNGFYAGSTIGGSFLTARENISSDNQVYFPLAPGPASYTTSLPEQTYAKIGHSAAIGAIFAGAGITWKDAYLGTEIFANYSNYQMAYAENIARSLTTVLSPVTEAYSLDVNLQSSPRLNPFQYGIDLRPGYFVKPKLLVFTRFGYVRAQIKQNDNIQVTVNYSNASTNDTFIKNYAVTTSHATGGFRVGAGFEYILNEDWSIRADYIYTSYGSLRSNQSGSDNISSPAYFGNGTLTTNNIIYLNSLAANAVNIGISYYFTAYNKEYGF
ncbi:MAG: hypothetical protein A3F18_00215 [Legionellales bacterium RIFCSPHIGHO2_12_FULL_37_14]|nr:MAG: hypothetical protein A3F18_00215 [Legionellales bacterium RIFCSPHIGHO2_12_FULL_37_14]